MGTVSSTGAVTGHCTSRSRAALVTVCASSSASSADLPIEPPSEPIADPYKALGVTPLSSFEQIKQAHARRQREAEAKGDSAALQLVG